MSRLIPGVIAGSFGTVLTLLLAGCASSPATEHADAGEPATTVADADTVPVTELAGETDTLDEAPAAPRLEIRRASRRPVEGWDEMPVYRDDRERRRWVAPDAVLTDEHVASAELVDGEDRRGVRIRLNESGEEIFRAFTREHVGESIALLVDGRVLNTPVIQSEVGPVFIVAGVAEEGLDEDLAQSLAGAF